MPRVLYNEGRVVGYSAYEIYMRHALTADPDATPASEAEWLASTLGFGSSMLLYVEAEADSVSGPHYVEYELPATSRLCGSNTIFGSLFIGAGDENTWSEKVTDYGQLISNNSTASPTSSSIPTQTITDVTQDLTDEIRDFSKIIDGVVIQQGTWTATSSTPTKDLVPDFTDKPKVRLQLKDRITTGFYLLLSGFTDSGVIYGVSATTGSTSTSDPQNGDFLGPAAFPWAAKIIFSLPTAAIANFGVASYTRQFPSDVSALTSEYSSIIDMDSANVTTYYTSNDTASKVDVTVSDVSTIQTGLAVLATRGITGTVDGVSGVTLPPDMLGGSMTATGTIPFGPIASYSPYSLHLFNGDIADTTADSPVLKAKLLESFAAGAYSFVRDDSSLVVYEIDRVTNPSSPALIPVSDNVVDNANVLQIYNTGYVYLRRQASGGGVPSAEDLQSVSSFTVNQQIYGYVSDEFLSICLTSSEVTSRFLTGGSATWMLNSSIFLTMYNQLEFDRNGNRIYGVNGANSPYVYFLMAINGGYVGPSQNMFLVPVEKNTHRISVMIPAASTIQIDSETPLGIDCTSKLDYLGSWWNATSFNASDPNLGTWGPFIDHPLQRVAIPNIDAYYQPNALVPKPPASYGYDYRQWYKDTKVFNNLIGSAVWAAKGIDDSYKSLSIQDFIMKAATNYIGYPMDSDQAKRSHGASLNFDRYIMSKTVIDATIAGGYSTVDDATVFNVSLKADLYIKAKIEDQHFFSPAALRFYAVTWSGDTSTISTDESTDTYISTEHELWSAIGQSGTHKTTSVSLTDQAGNPLPLVGSSGDITVDKVTWNDLLDALNHNKSLDLLGTSMTSMKTAIDAMTVDTNYYIKKNSDGTISFVPVE